MIYIASTISDNYCQYLAILLTSLIKNHKSSSIHYFIVSSFISEKHKKLIQRLVRGSRINVEFVIRTKLSDLNLKIDKHANIVNYFRLYLPDVIPHTIRKLLYLDSDLIVLDDIKKLWNIDVEKFALAGVPKFNEERGFVLGIDSNKYVNSGVLLMNIDYWRRNKLAGKIIQFIRRNPDLIKYWDQDGINYVLKNQILFIDECWNFTGMYKDDLGIKILHFVGWHKPWSIHYGQNNNKKIYNEYFIKYKISHFFSFLK